MRARGDQNVAQAVMGGGQEVQEERPLGVNTPNGFRYAPGHVGMGGRPVGSVDKIPRSVKRVLEDVLEGIIEAGYRDPVTGEIMTGPMAHMLVEKIAEGLRLPAEDALGYVRTLLEYGVGRPKTQADTTAEAAKKQLPRMIFLHEPHDSLAPPGVKKPMRILGQVAGPNGEIIDVRTGKVIGTAVGLEEKKDDGLGEGEERLEVVEDKDDYGR